LYGEGPKIQEAKARELSRVMERSVGSRCENIRKLTDLRPLHDRYNDFCKIIGQKLHGETKMRSEDVPCILLLERSAGASAPCVKPPARTATQAGNWGLDLNTMSGPYEDLDAFLHRADELALSLLEQGVTAMKIWPFDFAAD
jgi:hypothetical protein